MELKAQAERNLLALKENPYPGRGIIVGMDETGKFLVQIYWIMGRSENSRNRIFVEKKGEVKTSPADPTKVKDPSLIIYTAMDQIYYNSGTFDENNMLVDNVFAVSNGHQTTDALCVDLKPSLTKWQYEPDAPNFTPRITARFKTFYNYPTVTEMSILRKSPVSDTCERLLFKMPLTPGFGHCITTYTGDGNPLPSFEGDPYVLPLTGSMEKIADSIWNSLNEENRISLAIKFINPEERGFFTKVINKFKAV